MIQSVYVHAPFCSRRCSYCGFSVTTSRHGDLPGWLRALERELALVEADGYFSLSTELNTLFVGGGTPSLLGPDAMRGLAAVLGPGRLEAPGLEWTAEANPESFTRPVAEGWASAGVNRLSIGAQSFQEPVLRCLKRAHGPGEVTGAVAAAREAGISNVNLDLIFGLPREVERDWGRDLDAALALQVPHLSLYGLTVEEGTPLARAIEGHQLSPPDDGDYREQFLRASERLTSEGYRHYEVSNFSLPGYEARHNQVYWALSPYLGLGNSAHSFRPPRRRWNLRDWPAYEEACGKGEAPWDSEEVLTPAETRLEEIWLGLRTDRGIPVRELTPAATRVAETWIANGQAVRDGDNLRLTPEGWLLLDRLVVDMDLAQE